LVILRDIAYLNTVIGPKNLPLVIFKVDLWFGSTGSKDKECKQGKKARRMHTGFGFERSKLAHPN
jgi:hypothetical protein